MENNPKPISSSSHSSGASSVSPSKLQQHDFSNNSDKNTNMLFAFLCEKIGDSAAQHIQEVFNAKSRRLEAENIQLKARNAALEGENARLRNQIEIKDAIISNGSPKTAKPNVVPAPAAAENVSRNGDTNGKKKNGHEDGANAKNNEDGFNAKLAKVQQEFHHLLQASQAKQNAMETKIVKADIEISALKKGITDLAVNQENIVRNQKEFLKEIDELHGIEELTRDDIISLMQKVTSLERNFSSTASKPQPGK